MTNRRYTSIFKPAKSHHFHTAAPSISKPQRLLVTSFIGSIQFTDVNWHVGSALARDLLLSQSRPSG